MMTGMRISQRELIKDYNEMKYNKTTKILKYIVEILNCKIIVN